MLLTSSIPPEFTMLNPVALVSRVLFTGLLSTFLVWSLPVSAQVNQAQVAQAKDTLTPDVKALLTKMAGASHKLNYRGTFTYQHKDNPSLNSFRIYHWVEEGIEYERLQHLNGPEREISRSGRSLDCQSMGDQLLLGHVTGEQLTQLDDLYRFEIRGPERVAGRNATVLLAVPLDAYRYSYFLSIDNETGLVLKSWLVDEAARPMERYQFIELDLDPDLSGLKKAAVPRLHRNTDTPIPECNPSTLKEPTKWQPHWVPPGFAFVGEKVVRTHIDMLMYTDGLASFSIFIEPSQEAVPEGVAKRGATLAAMDQLILNNQRYRITVVGEIPVAAAQKIAQNIHDSSSSQ